MAWTDNPVSDYESYSNEMEEEIEKCPVCDICNEHIQDDYYFEINGDIICESCMVDYFRKNTEDFVG